MRVKKKIVEKRGRWGRRRSDFVIRYLLLTSLAAHIVLGVSLIMGCSEGSVLALDNPSGTVDGGGIWGGGGPAPPSSGPLIEIYFDGDETRNRAGQELTFDYDRSAASHPTTTRKITVKLIEGPEDFPNLVWQIRNASALTNGMLTPSADWNPPQRNAEHLGPKGHATPCQW